MARKLADLKAPIAFISPRAYKSEDSEVRDHVGSGELLRPENSLTGGKMDRAAELFLLRSAHSSANTLVGSETTSVLRMVATLQSWPTAATPEDVASGPTGESSSASKSGGRFSCARRSNPAKALALPCEGRVHRLRACSARGGPGLRP